MISLLAMSGKKAKPANLREACIREALSIIERSGVEELSLREVARRLGVSHQAPYKHFPSRDHILAEIVARAFESFAQHLDARPQTDDPDADLGEMGVAYLRYAQAHPLQYRLMFGTPLPDPRKHPEMMKKARHAFSLLRDGLRRLPSKRQGPEHQGPEQEAEILQDALFIWSTLHGLASLSGSSVLRTLDLPPELHESAISHTLLRIGTGIGKGGAGP